jgi:secondary thiamine-phosphate synthase enzyme
MEGNRLTRTGRGLEIFEPGVATPGFACRRDALRIATTTPVEIVDLTRQLERFVTAAGLETGWVSVQSLHTTCGLAVNEHEPRLLADLVALLERLAPRDAGYAHDALHLRDDVPPDERPNGHAHAKALLLRTAETLHVVDGRLQLGRWQRLLLLELDGPRERELSLLALGTVRR